MFKILKEYLALRTQQGKLYDWNDIAYHVQQEYLQDDRVRRYRHIIIDEGQDFSPEMIRSLASAIPGDGSLTFFWGVRKLLKGEIKARGRKNVLQARSFAELLEDAIKKYQNRAIETAQVIEELIALAKDLREPSVSRRSLSSACAG